MRIGDFKETYADDEAVFRTGTVRFWLGMLGLALTAFPFVAGEYVIYMANITGVAVVGAVGLNVLTGFTGQISLGHAAFMGVGAYTSAILTTQGVPFLATLPLAGAAAAICGLIGSILGAIFGAIFMTVVPEVLRSALGLFQGLDPQIMRYLFPLQTVIFGLLIVVFLVFEPHGLAEIWRRVKAYFRLWPFEY